MKKTFLFVIAAIAAAAQINEIAGARIRAHVKFLSSDLLEGRGVGARGGTLATEYLATQFALLGAKPAGDNGTYFQNFALIGAEPQPSTELTMVPANAETLRFRWLDEFVGVSLQQMAESTFDAPAVFVGHGIVA